ncbi:hypothetical protein [Nanobdella aerobiophila]|nr:hypothetical protein [Nanobdella aerobiophila]
MKKIIYYIIYNILYNYISYRLYFMEKNYNVICESDIGLEEYILYEIKNILNKDINYDINIINNKINILLDLEEEDIIRLMYYSRTLDNIYKLGGSERIRINLSNRNYNIFNINRLKSTLVSKILYLSRIYEAKNILNLMDDGSFSIEEGILLKNIPVIFWKMKDIKYTIDFQIYNKVDKKIYCVHKDPNLLYKIEKNSEKALVDDITIFRRINIEWLDQKFKSESIDRIFVFKIKNRYELSKKEKYIFFQSDYLLRKGGKLYILLYNNINNYDQIIKNIIDYIKKYNIEYIRSYYIYNNNKKLLLLEFKKI